MGATSCCTDSKADVCTNNELDLAYSESSNGRRNMNGRSIVVSNVDSRALSKIQLLNSKAQSLNWSLVSDEAQTATEGEGPTNTNKHLHISILPSSNENESEICFLASKTTGLVSGWTTTPRQGLST